MTNHGWTPLHSAAEGGHLPICEMLRQNMPNKNPRDDRGFTPLHWAACYGNLSVCELIINDLQVKYFNFHMYYDFHIKQCSHSQIPMFPNTSYMNSTRAHSKR